MSTESTAFMGRQPILDRDQSIVGYELLFRDSATASAAAISDSRAAACRVIVDTFTTLGADVVLGDCLGFFNVTEELLSGSLLETLELGVNPLFLDRISERNVGHGKQGNDQGCLMNERHALSPSRMSGVIFGSIQHFRSTYAQSLRTFNVRSHPCDSSPSWSDSASRSTTGPPIPILAALSGAQK